MNPTKHQCAKGVLCTELVAAERAAESMRDAYLKMEQQAGRLAGALERLETVFTIHPHMGGGGSVTLTRPADLFERVVEGRNALTAWREREGGGRVKAPTSSTTTGALANTRARSDRSVMPGSTSTATTDEHPPKPRRHEH